MYSKHNCQHNIFFLINVVLLFPSWWAAISLQLYVERSSFCLMTAMKHSCTAIPCQIWSHFAWIINDSQPEMGRCLGYCTVALPVTMWLWLKANGDRSSSCSRSAALLHNNAEENRAELSQKEKTPRLSAPVFIWHSRVTLTQNRNVLLLPQMSQSLSDSP